MFLSSFKMFWPTKRSKTTVMGILDFEQKGSELEKTFIDKVISDGKSEPNMPNVTIKYHTPKIFYKKGHDRQQHVMFHADEYSSSEFIGFVDTDCLFFTNVDREDIFENNKPVVHGKIGAMAHGKKQLKILPTSLIRWTEFSLFLPLHTEVHANWARASYFALGMLYLLAVCLLYAHYFSLSTSQV